MNGNRPHDARRRPQPEAPASSIAEQLIAHAQAGREIVQDFVPLAESLEWELGHEYLAQRGNKAFLSDVSPVPFVVNNDGSLSRSAGDVFFASLVAADKEGQLDRDIFVLELGVGVGLFARFFLDRMRELCVFHKKDYYDRLCYIAADNSERMLRDVLRHGVLAEHPGRCLVRRVDAMKPEELLSGEPALANLKGKPFRAVFLNYLLDCLPAAVLELGGARPAAAAGPAGFEDSPRGLGEMRQLCVRTCVARNVNLADYTDLTPQQLRERAKANDPRAKNELLEIYGLLAAEYDYRPVDAHKVPYRDFVLDFGRKLTGRLLHSYGAIECLEKLLGLLADGGFILVNDYGQTQISRDDEFEHQRFSLATFVGVNFSLLREYFGEGKRCRYIEPAGEEGRGIHARLLARQLAPDVQGCFAERFGEAAHRALQEPIAKARACAKAGRFELASGFYRDAVRLQPRNWVLLCEVSQFLTFSFRNPREGADLAKTALRLNPTCSAELWNALGDALYEFGRTAEARSTYEKALSVNAADVRARYNLAWVHTREKDYPAALLRIAEALALDKTGEYRPRLLEKQQEVLARLTQRHQQEYLLLINLVSKYVNQDKGEGPTAAEHRE